MRSRLVALGPILAFVLAACASAATPAPTARRPPRPRPPRPAHRRPAPPGGSLTIYAAASLKAALGKVEDRLRGGLPGHDPHDLDRLVVGARDQDRAGRPGRRLPLGRHDQPAEAGRQGPGRRCRHQVRGQPAHGHRPDRQPGPHPDTSRSRAARRQDRRRGRHRADHQVRHPARREPCRAGRAIRTSSRPVRAQRRRPGRTTSPGSSRRSSSARATPAIVYVTDAKTSTKVTTIAVPPDGQRPRHVRRRDREGLHERDGGGGVPRPGSPVRTGRRSWPRSGSCRRPDRRDRPPTSDHARGRAGRWAFARSSAWPSCPALFLACPWPCSWSGPFWTGRSGARSRRRSSLMPWS